MASVSPRELLAQLEEFVEVLAMPAELQRSWANDHNAPIDELVLQLLDAVPGWFARLRASGLIDDGDELALLRLRVQFDAVMSGRENLFSDWQAVADAPEWQRTRDLASVALASIRRPSSQKQ
jgi:hypothetical protein